MSTEKGTNDYRKLRYYVRSRRMGKGTRREAKRTGLDDHGRGRLDAEGFREWIHDAPYGVIEGRAFAAMSATVDDVDGILNIKETFKRVVDSGHKVYLYMVIKNSGCGTKTIRYAVI